MLRTRCLCRGWRPGLREPIRAAKWLSQKSADPVLPKHPASVAPALGPPTTGEKLAIASAILERSKWPPEPIRLHEFARYKKLRGQPAPLPDLLANASYVISEITTRLARRLDSLRDLPLIVVLNEHISEIYNIYYNSFRVMSSIADPESEEEHSKFVDILNSLVGFHSDMIPILAQGFSQCSFILDPESVNRMLWDHIQARIGTRLLAEHHIALTNPIGPNFVGCIQTDLNPSHLAKKVESTVAELTSLQFGFTPHLRIDMGEDVQLAYPPNHLEYILTELLKNSFIAMANLGETMAEEHPVVMTVISSGDGAIVRVRDRGGGIRPENEQHIFKFAYTTVDRGGEEGLVEGTDSSLAGLGFGLPLSKAYAEFFGGKLQLQSYHGWGTDAYLNLKSPMVSGYRRDIL